MTHEIGHLLGSRHTHACVWNGNNTAIDGCAIPEGGCTRPPTPTNEGTIMSYCDHMDSESYVNFNLGFGPQPGNVIRNSVNSASCLSSYSIQFTGSSIVCGQNSYTYTIQNLPPNTTITWSSSNNSMTLISGQGTPNAVFQQTGFTNGEIRATIAPFTTLRFPITICQPHLSGSTSVCNQATYTVENLPQGAIVWWSLSNNNVTLTSGQGTHTATFTKFRNEMEIINAEILLNNIRIALLTKETYFGAPSISYIIGEQRVQTGQYASYRAVISNNAPIPSSYQWILNPLNGNYLYGNGTESIDIAFYNPGSYQLVCRATNECGVGDYYAMGIGVYDNLYLTLSPNPATDAVTLQLMETDEVSGLSVLSTDRSTYEIQLWSGMTMLRSFRTNEPTFQISMAGLPAGLYFVRVVKNGQTYTQKLIKK